MEKKKRYEQPILEPLYVVGQGFVRDCTNGSNAAAGCNPTGSNTASCRAGSGGG
jgi:hypothetical protein